MRVKRFIFLLFSFLLLSRPCAASESHYGILRMDVTAEVAPNGLLTVMERIVFKPGSFKRAGFVRYIPALSRFPDNAWLSRFILHSAMLNGEKFELSQRRMNDRIAVGTRTVGGIPDRDAPFELVVRYSLVRQIAARDDVDELQWSVTGGLERFPIDALSFRVVLPPGATIRERDVRIAASNRSEGGWRVVSSDTVETTRGLGEGESVTVSFGWDKGFVRPSTGGMFDGEWRAAYAGVVFLYIVIFAGAWFTWGRDPRRTLAIPLYSLPERLEPGFIGFIKTLRYDTHLLFADLLQLAMQGQICMKRTESRPLWVLPIHCLEIEKCVESWGEYISPAHRQLLDALFMGDKKSVLLGHKKRGRVLVYAQAFAQRMHDFYKANLPGNMVRPHVWQSNAEILLRCFLLLIPFFCFMRMVETPLADGMRRFGLWIFVVLFPAGWFSVVGIGLRARKKRSRGVVLEGHSKISAVIGILALFGMFCFYLAPIYLEPSPQVNYLAIDPLLIGGAWVVLFIVFVAAVLMPRRTKVGRDLLDQIEGFELYLNTAERGGFDLRHFNKEDTGLRMTSEWHEHILPYAYALGVRIPWASDFAAVLERDYPGKADTPQSFPPQPRQ